MAIALEASGEYRVLRRVRQRPHICEPDGTPTKIGVLLDVEATGLDTATAEIIELGMVKFEFCPASGRIYRILGTFDAFQQPSVPIPAEITELTGITDEMVAGQAIDPLAVAAFVDPAVIVIAHNASYDRKMVERVWSCFTTKAWGCSRADVDWKTEGVDGAKLGYLLSHAGLFHDGHRAFEDCLALVEVLALPLPKSGETALKRLLDTARKATIRIWAENSPFDSKDTLKARGYRWSDGSDGGIKAWWRDVPEDDLAGELAYLRNEIYQREVDLPTRRINTFDRYSVRA